MISLSITLWAEHTVKTISFMQPQGFNKSSAGARADVHRVSDELKLQTVPLLVRAEIGFDYLFPFNMKSPLRFSQFRLREMPDQTSILPALATEPIQSPTFNTSVRRVLTAAFMSAVLPGAGHLVLHRRRAGIAMLILFCALLSICWPLRLLIHVAAVIGLVFGMLALPITAVVDSAYSRGHGQARPSQWWLVILLPLALGAAFGHVRWAVRAAGFQSFEVPSRSMENTVPQNAHVMVDRWYYETHAPIRGDIVVNINPDGIYLMKRVIALGGETIQSADGQIFIDDKPITEPYVVRSGYAPPEFNNFGPLKIPAGKLFVMGDSRNLSLDSRSPEVGPIDVTSLRGRALYTLPGGDRQYKQLQ